MAIPQVQALSPERWKAYELLDSGNGNKLERFGSHTIIRPEPQAVWDASLTRREWDKLTDVVFVPKSSSSGTWTKHNPVADRWEIIYPLKIGAEIHFRLGLTAFKHVGVFPEQAVNWEYIADAIADLKKRQREPVRFLNLFAYTGGASLAACAAGAETYHLDSIKQVVTWSRENMERSGLRDIRWIVEDAMKFVRREVKRGSRYHGIILDPPAYGHGPDGEKWKLEDQLNEMMTSVQQLLHPEHHFLILNAYSLGFSPLILENLVRLKGRKVEIGELYLTDQFDKNLPLGAFARFRSY
jgi:23S rRNA (cytosine1962-C5)-methyltransferase